MPLALSWLRSRAPLAALVAAVGACAAASRGEAAGADLSRFAAALGRASGGASVSPDDVRWEPTEGAVADATSGRWVLYLARAPGEDARDVWRARARVSPEGRVVEVVEAHDLTNTPLGDDHALVVRGTHAAFATRAYDQVQSVTALDLSGEGAQNKTDRAPDRAMAAVTNVQQTGTSGGVGRWEITLAQPAAGVSLAISDGALDITSYERTPVRERLDLATGDLSPATSDMTVAASMHLPKRFSHWAVDTLRAVPWIGPAPIAWAEDQALSARDALRRMTFRASGDATDVVASADPPPPPLDTSQASVEEAHWPPPRIATIWQKPEAGEGEWSAPDVPWLRRMPGVASDAPSPMCTTFLRPDEERPYSKVLLVAMDLRQLDLDMEAGVEDPEPLVGPHGSGRIPRDPAVFKRVVAAFNGAFKTEHGHYGMMVHKRVLLPPVPASASVVVLDDGRVGMGTWGADRKVGGLRIVSAEGSADSVRDDSIVSFRQNLDALVDRGQINPTGRNLWGFTLPGKGVQTERSGLCVTSSGHLLYAWGDDVSATALAKAMKMAGCDYAMHLDMNPFHTGFLFATIDDPAAKKYKTQLLDSGMQIPTDRYVQYAPKDFFYVMVHDPTPPAIDGASPWRADGGSQPPPKWMPGVWSARVDGAQGGVEVIDVEAQRATWRIRAGAKEAPAASPARELAGEEAKRVLLAIGMGVASDKRPRGIATDGRVAVPVRGGDDYGAIEVDVDGRLTIARGETTVAPHADLAELPVVVWDGRAAPRPAGAIEPRAAIGTTASGRVLVARGTLSSDAPLAEALARAGCTRALALDRGVRPGPSVFDRAGTASPPRARYDESVLYAIASPLHPRGFRFEPATLVAQGSKPK